MTTIAMSTLDDVGLGEANLAPAYALIEHELVGAQVPGVVLALARREGPVSVRTFGRAQWQPADVPARPDTIFALASITKPIVSVAVMQQVERGKFLLDDPIVRHLPEFGANDKGSVTVRHLLSHTSGLDEAWLMERFREDPERAATWERQVATICEAPLRFVPGTLQAYCNPPFTILSELVRRASGLRIDSYLEQRVCDPLGMSDTRFFPPDSVEARRAAVATERWPESAAAREGPAVASLAAAYARRIPRPSGGLHSTVADLIAFGRACLQSLRGERYHGAALLSRAAMQAMLRPQTEGLNQWVDADAGAANVPQPGPVRGLGFALVGRTGHDFLSPAAFGHGGATGTQLLVDPEQDLIVVFLTNRTGWDGRGRQLAINAALAGASSPANQRDLT